MADLLHTLKSIGATAVKPPDAYEVSETKNNKGCIPNGLTGVSVESVERKEYCFKLNEEDFQVLRTIFSRLESGEDDLVSDNKAVLSSAQLITNESSSVDKSSALVSSAVKPRAETQSMVSLKVIKSPLPKKLQQKASVERIIPISTPIIRPKTAPVFATNKLRPNINDTANIFNFELYKRYKQRAAKAIQEHKVFTILGGYPTVRKELLNRGWLERLWESHSLQQCSQHTLLKQAKSGNEYEVAALSKFLNAYSANFVWYPRYMRITKFDNVNPLKSRMTRSREFDFTLKEGLVNISRSSQWFHIPGKSELACPRSYRLFVPEELSEFMADYRFTGCTSLLAFLVDGQRADGYNIHFTEDGKLNSISELSNSILNFYSISRISSDCLYQFRNKTSSRSYPRSQSRRCRWIPA